MRPRRSTPARHVQPYRYASPSGFETTTMRHILALAFVLVIARPALADSNVEKFAPRASGVALAEVTAVEPFDGRPMDGPASVTFKLKLIRGSGAFPGEVSVITAYPGGMARGFVPKPSLPVKPDSFKKGDRIWFAFASTHESDKHNQGVIGFWPENDAKAEALEAAVKADAYRWSPQYDPKTKLTYGRIIENDKWRVRVEKDGKQLWHKEVPGTKASDYDKWGLVDDTGGTLVVTMPRCGKILLAETSRRVENDNEFGIAAGTYWIKTGFDPETGQRLASWVRLPQPSHVAVVDRRYDPATGHPQFEQRYAFLRSGGKAAGAKSDDWFRKIERTFDATGKVTKEDVFRYDGSVEGRWAKAPK